MLRALTTQWIAVLSTGGIAAYADGLQSGLAVLYGGGAALANAGLLLWRMRQGARNYHCDGARHLRSFYRSSLERFFVVGAWLGVGLGVMALPALPVLAGFFIGMLAWMVALAIRS